MAPNLRDRRFYSFPQQLSSSIYRLSAEGAPEELWNSRDDVVYSLALNSDGRLLAGTGNSGALLAIDGRGVSRNSPKLVCADHRHRTNSAGKLFLCTANPESLLRRPEYEPEGTYESRSFDAQLFSQWGRLDGGVLHLRLLKKNRAKSSSRLDAPRLEFFFVRSGNTEDPGKEWSRWSARYAKPGPTPNASSRFVHGKP